MSYEKIDIKQGIKLHKINTEKFKTNLLAVFLTTKLNRQNVTKNALISSILRRGTKNMPTSEQISKTLEQMYGASFDCGLDKTGDNQVLKFYIETVNDEFLPQEAENMLKTSLEEIFEFVFNPYLENNCFKKEYVEQEKENLKQIIEGKIEGKIEGQLLEQVRLITKKVQKGQSMEQIAEILEKDPKEIADIYRAVVSSAPRYDVDEICKDLMEKQRL